MALTDILDYVVTLISGVSGIGNVRKYQRFAKDQKNFMELFSSLSTSTGKRNINHVYVTRNKTTENLISTISGKAEILRTHTLGIYFMYSFNSSISSEETFQNLLEDMCDVLREKHTLGGNVQTSGLPQIVMIDVIKFGNVLVHAGELNLLAQSLILQDIS